MALLQKERIFFSSFQHPNIECEVHERCERLKRDDLQDKEGEYVYFREENFREINGGGGGIQRCAAQIAQKVKKRILYMCHVSFVL